MWGTLMGVRAYTRGESFVARNVGLRSVWEDGEWKVKIIFMDHDAMGIMEPNWGDFAPEETFFGMQLDETYLWGRVSILGTVGHLRRMYEVSDELYERGRKLARAEAKQAYDKTQQKLLTEPALSLAVVPEGSSKVHHALMPAGGGRQQFETVTI